MGKAVVYFGSALTKTGNGALVSLATRQLLESALSSIGVTPGVSCRIDLPNLLPVFFKKFYDGKPSDQSRIASDGMCPIHLTLLPSIDNNELAKLENLIKYSIMVNLRAQFPSYLGVLPQIYLSSDADEVGCRDFELFDQLTNGNALEISFI